MINELLNINLTTIYLSTRQKLPNTFSGSSFTNVMICRISPFLFLCLSEFGFLDGWSDKTSHLETAINSDEHWKITGLIRKMIGGIIDVKK